MRRERHLAAAGAFLLIAGMALVASDIHPEHKHGWGENIGWLNWRDADGGDAGVIVHETFLSGYIWAENVGWINVGDGTPVDGVHYANTDEIDFGVNIYPGTGNLFGLGWGENIGWVNFDTFTAEAERARYNPATMTFSGYAWGENVGWINVSGLKSFADCNTNGWPDDLDISGGTSQDCNSNGVPDECDIAAGTATGSGEIIFAGTGLDLYDDPSSEFPTVTPVVSDTSIQFDATSGDWQVWARYPLFAAGTFSQASADTVVRAVIDTSAFGPDSDFAIGVTDGTLVVLTQYGTTGGPTGTPSCVSYPGTTISGDTIATLGSPVDLFEPVGAFLPWTVEFTLSEAYSGLTATIDQLSGSDSTFAALDRSAALDWVLVSGDAGSDFLQLDTLELSWIPGTDCNSNGIPDECDIADGTSEDCNTNGVPDECAIAVGISADCQPDQIPDECQLVDNDCNTNGTPDDCDISAGTSEDCNGNGVPDECDVSFGTSADCNANDTPDECEYEPQWSHEFVVGVKPRAADSHRLIEAMEVYDDGSGPALHVAGIYFESVEGVPARRVAKWDGTEWSAVGGGLPPAASNAYTMAVFDFDAAGPEGSKLCLTTNNGFYTWDGSAWANEPTGPKTDLLVYDLDTDGTPELYGAFMGVGADVRYPVVKRVGASWATISGTWGPQDGDVWSIAGLDADGDGPHPPAIFAAGRYGSIDGVSAIGIAKWDGTTWTAADAGWWAGGFQAVSDVKLAVYDDDEDGPNLPALYAFVRFSYSGVGVLRWDGSAWENLWWQSDDRWLGDLTVFDDDGDGPNLPALYVAGHIKTEWGAPADGIAKWDGTSWEPLGQGFCVRDYEFPTALAGFDEDGAGPNPPSLYVGGNFDSAGGGMARQITRWGKVDGGRSLDCDTDGILDACELAADPSLDCDLDGVLDSCTIAGYAEMFGHADGWDTYNPGDDGVGAAGYGGAIFDGRYVYFVPYEDSAGIGVSIYHGEVLRYDTAGDFTNLASWAAFDAGENGVGTDPDGYVGGVFDGRYIYLAPAYNGTDSHGEVLRYDTESAFDQAGSWSTFDAKTSPSVMAAGGYRGAVFDGQYVYFVPYHDGTSTHTEVLRYDTTLLFDEPTSWTTFAPLPDGGYWDGTFDGRYVYLAPYWSATAGYHGEVLRYDTMGTFTEVGSWDTFDAGLNGVGSDPDGYWGAEFDGQYVYFAPYHNGTERHGEVLRYDTGSAFSSASSWKTFDARSMNVGHRAAGFSDAVFDGSYVYFVGYMDPSLYEREIHGEVLRYDATAADPDFDDPSLWTPSEENAFCIGSQRGGFLGGVFDGRHLYFAPYQYQYRTGGGSWPVVSSGEVVRFDTTAGLSPDCNTNGIPDECDLSSGTSLDVNTNGVPDECDPVTADVTDLQANPGNGSVQLTWTASPDATGYMVYVDDGGGFDAGTDLGDVTQYDATDLTNGLRYLFKVTAYNPGLPDSTGVLRYATPFDGYQGLTAAYSSGETVLEGPIFHGWWGDCAATGNNQYQGECTPVSSCPVDWAWGDGFDVTWTGFMYAPIGGTYSFSGWVDGIVYVEIDGTVVADLSTTGDSYDDTVLLTEGTWVPVLMTFTPNGGSNNMQLSWSPPGVPWEPVPLHYLATMRDCNGNDLPDGCDLDCGSAGGPCDLPGCGASPDCNTNGNPDECDITGGTSDDFDDNGVPDECEANLLVNPGFEIAEVIEDGSSWVFGDWRGDEASVVTAENGITPRSGQQMLRCDYTSYQAPDAEAISCDVIQLVDVSSVTSGNAVATGSFWANRVAGDAETDTAYQLIFRAHGGDPIDFPSNELAVAAVLYYTDADPATWEKVDLQLHLPPDTVYVAFSIGPIENVFNDGTDPEFDGHYIDDCFLRVDPLLVNPGFEVVEVIEDGSPHVYGDWRGDEANVVATENGITPYGGAQMLRFDYTSSQAPHAEAIGCEVIQLVSVDPVDVQVASGNAMAAASFWANRVEGDAETDTAFQLIIRAHNGDPADFPTDEVGVVAVTLLSDGEVGTWEKVSTQLLLPPDTTYVAVSIGPYENVFNDDSDPEFDGHYGDDVRLSIKLAGDVDGDGDIDLEDYDGFEECLDGPAGDLPPECDLLDIDNDGDVDLRDYAAFQSAFD